MIHLWRLLVSWFRRDQRSDLNQIMSACSESIEWPRAKHHTPWKDKRREM